MKNEKKIINSIFINKCSLENEYEQEKVSICFYKNRAQVQIDTKKIIIIILLRKI